VAHLSSLQQVVLSNTKRSLFLHKPTAGAVLKATMGAESPAIFNPNRNQQEGEEPMSVYKRGGTWWFKFRFEGQVIRQSAKTASKTVAKEAERIRRRQLEDAANGIARREHPVLFSISADRWLESLSGGLKPITLGHYRVYAGKLKERFRNRLIIDIDAQDIASMQRDLAAQGFSGRTVNLQVAVLRMILRYWRLGHDSRPCPYASRTARRRPGYEARR
jgi:hypothetical protein